MIGIIHFMDVWNIDLDQVQRCVIHYATPGEVRPFCIQQHPPNNVEKQFAILVSKWTEKFGKRLSEPV